MELNGMGHIFYGPSLELIWEELWSIYVYYVDLIWATALHIKPMDVSFFRSVVYCYGMTTYFVKVRTFSIALCLGMVWVCPIAIPYDPHLALWDCYVFCKVPYNSHSTAQIDQLAMDMGVTVMGPLIHIPYQYHRTPKIPSQTMGNVHVWDLTCTHRQPIAQLVFKYSPSKNPYDFHIMTV